MTTFNLTIQTDDAATPEEVSAASEWMKGFLAHWNNRKDRPACLRYVKLWAEAEVKPEIESTWDVAIEWKPDMQPGDAERSLPFIKQLSDAVNADKDQVPEPIVAFTFRKI